MCEYIKVSKANIEKEHICCNLSGEASYKKEWMQQMYKYGYTFIKLNERAKVFIDFIPAEYAFVPLQAKDYMYICCLWVSGKYAHQGHATRLLALAEKEAKEQGKKGMVIVSHIQKKPYRSDSKFLLKAGYQIVDETKDKDLLMCKSFKDEIENVCFLDTLKKFRQEEGFVLYYSKQCPFPQKYAFLIKEEAKKNNINLHLVEIKTYEQAQSLGILSTMFSLFYNGELIASEVLTPSKFMQLVKKYEANQ